MLSHRDYGIESTTHWMAVEISQSMSTSPGQDIRYLRSTDVWLVFTCTYAGRSLRDSKVAMTRRIVDCRRLYAKTGIIAAIYKSNKTIWISSFSAFYSDTSARSDKRLKTTRFRVSAPALRALKVKWYFLGANCWVSLYNALKFMMLANKWRASPIPPEKNDNGSLDSAITWWLIVLLHLLDRCYSIRILK